MAGGNTGNTANTVASADGTPIAWWREGAGPALLLVHGGLCDHLAWYFVVPVLAQRFTVWSFDRRGRGASGDTPPHSVTREVEDIGAMLRLIDEPAHLLGHSAGAILALAASLQTDQLRSLILYDPPFIIDGARARPGPEVLMEIEGLLSAGDRDQALRIAMRESVGLSDREMDGMQAGPGWDHLRNAAAAIPYDWKIWEESLDPARLSALETCTLLMLGSESPPWIRASTEALLAALPRAQMVLVPGQGHSAMVTAPNLFAEKVTHFAAEVDRKSSPSARAR